LLLGLNLLCVLGLGLGVFGRVWQANMAYQAEMDELRSYQAQWQQTEPLTYTFLYTYCTSYGTCCQAAPVEVVGDSIPILPTCATSLNTLSYYPGIWDGPQYNLLTLRQVYNWAEYWREEYPRRYMSIEYHPELHYITRLEYEPTEGANRIVVEYQLITED
jgi:hypothetical protein